MKNRKVSYPPESIRFDRDDFNEIITNSKDFHDPPSYVL
jgi:hypothetical protein